MTPRNPIHRPVETDSLNESEKTPRGTGSRRKGKAGREGRELVGQCPGIWESPPPRPPRLQPPVERVTSTGLPAGPGGAQATCPGSSSS